MPRPRRAIALPALMVASALLAGFRPALAQRWSWTSMAEAAGDGVSLVQMKLARSTAEAGLHATLNLAVERLWSELDDVGSVHPTYGVQYVGTPGRVQLDVGYSFRGASDRFPFFSGSRSGPTAGLQFEAPVGGRVTVAGDAVAYWHATYVRGRALATGRVAAFANGSTLRAGGDVTWQTEWETDVPGTEYRARQVGALLRWSHPRSFTVGAGAGHKRDSYRTDDTGYLKIELSFSR